ncbi:MAG: pentapeptide repeat-containing protein [bacterium]|nr:pentapeptide repeat-containing protein [bacterium]
MSDEVQKALNTLKLRLAAGEIDEETFCRQRQLMLSDSPATKGTQISSAPTTAQENMRQSALRERIELLTVAAEEAARQLRNVYLTFILVGTYIAIAIGSTTDEQLLKVSPVKLPLLNVGLPIVGFYALVPWLLLLLHFNLLQQLYLLASKLHPLDAAISTLPDTRERQVRHMRLSASTFSHWLVGRHHGPLMRALLALTVWMTVILLPLVLLVWGQIRFLPYHDVTITWIQRVAGGLDIVVLWIFWPLIVEPSGHIKNLWRALVRYLWWLAWVWTAVRLLARTKFRQRARAVAARWLRARRTSSGLRAPAIMSILAQVRAVRLKRVRRMAPSLERWLRVREDSKRTTRLALLFVTGLFAVWLSLFVAVVPNESMEQMVPEILRLRNTSSCREGCFAPTFWLFEASRAPFHRNLQLVEKVIVNGEPSAEVVAGLQSDDKEKQANVLKKVAGLKLANRDLRFANLRSAALPKADLRGAELQGANLRKARLQGANLSRARLQGTYLWETQLDSADLRMVQSQGARLWRAQLQNADLEGAWLQGASLWQAQLQGANLQRAQLQSTSLSETQLQGADLRRAQLQGADLRLAHLQGANCSGAVVHHESRLGSPPAARRASSARRVRSTSSAITRSSGSAVRYSAAMTLLGRPSSA